MLLELDHMTDYGSSRTYKFNVNDHKSVIIDTCPNGDIESLWLFDYSRPSSDHIVAWGSHDPWKLSSNIEEVVDIETGSLNTDLLAEVADNMIMGC